MDSYLVMFDRWIVIYYFLFVLQNYEKVLRQDWFKLVHFQILMKKMKEGMVENGEKYVSLLQKRNRKW